MSKWSSESSGLLSSYTISTPDDFYTTVSSDEEILFTDINAKRRKVNEVTIIANGGATLKIQLYYRKLSD